MKRYFCRCLVVLSMLVAGAAVASYHTFVIDQLYSNADATVQFIVLHESLGEDGENFLRGHTLKSTHAGVTQTYTFTRDLPGGGCVYSGYSSECTMSPTANSRVLIGTQGFAAISTVAPDYLIPNGFLSTGSGLVNYADVDFMSYGSLPTDGVSALNRNGTMIQNLATNFNGQSTSLSLAGPPSVFGNFQGLWWNDPDESESGWGINFNHQGSTIFATWFTFGLAGQPLWLVAVLTSTPAAPNVFTGDLLTFSGSRFDAFDPTKVVSAPAGSITITFSDLNHATFQNTAAGVPQIKHDQAPTAQHQPDGSPAAGARNRTLRWRPITRTCGMPSRRIRRRGGASISPTRATRSSRPGSPMGWTASRCGWWRRSAIRRRSRTCTPERWSRPSAVRRSTPSRSTPAWSTAPPPAP